MLYQILKDRNKRSPDKVAVLYTSGTTGNQKGIVLAHDQMMIHTTNHCKLVSLALSNNFAFSHQMLCALYVGATLEINSAFDPVEVLEKIKKNGITILYMMPVMFHILNKQASEEKLPIQRILPPKNHFKSPINRLIIKE